MIKKQPLCHFNFSIKKNEILSFSHLNNVSIKVKFSVLYRNNICMSLFSKVI
jgi:hypothetical protein